VSVIGGRVFVALTLIAALSDGVLAQDNTAAPRHLLSLDVSRMQPFRRAYEMIVRGRDSSIVIGQREVVLTAAVYSGEPSWLLVETRTGLVPAVESLYVAPDLRPLHWSSALGTARLGTEFVGDSIYGAMTSPTGKQNIVAAGRPDLLVSGAMLEALLPLLPLSSTWVDSVGVLSVDLATTHVIPAELAVVREEDLVTDTLAIRPTWVVALRAGQLSLQCWVDKTSGAVLRVTQALSSHTGTELEYRMRSDSVGVSP
jgi:hypothetical protein